MRGRRGGHTSGDKPIGELPKVSDRPAVGAIRVGNDPSKLFAKGDVILLANLHRLDLKPGDRLAVVLPDNITSESGMWEFAKLAQAQLDEIAPDVRALVLPPGTKLDVIRPQDDSPPRAPTHDEVRQCILREQARATQRPPRS